MNDLAPKLYRYSKVAACFVVSAIVSGADMHWALFIPGLAFGCMAFYCLRIVDDNRHGKIFALPLVSSIIYLLAFLMSMFITKITENIQ